MFLIFGCLLCPRDPCEHYYMEPFSSKGLLKVTFLRFLLHSINKKPFTFSCASEYNVLMWHMDHQIPVLRYSTTLPLPN